MGPTVAAEIERWQTLADGLQSGCDMRGITGDKDEEDECEGVKDVVAHFYRLRVRNVIYHAVGCQMDSCCLFVEAEVQLPTSESSA